MTGIVPKIRQYLAQAILNYFSEGQRDFNAMVTDGIISSRNIIDQYMLKVRHEDLLNNLTESF